MISQHTMYSIITQTLKVIVSNNSFTSMTLYVTRVIKSRILKISLTYGTQLKYSIPVFDRIF